MVRFLVASAQSLFREVLRLTLASHDGFVVVGEARNGWQAVSEAERTHPDIALIEADLPKRDGIQATALIRERVPGCRVAVVADHDDCDLLLRALEAGASGYITKDSSLAVLVEATNAMHRGEVFIPRQMMAPLLSGLMSVRDEREQALQRIATLTRREREVLSLLAEGEGSDRIARTLVISPDTARTHIQNVLGKLQVHSRLEAVALILKNRLADHLGAVR